ncbi:MAG: SDR family NAD(P)-dependent oxidoreductase [Candidatus Methylomirabilia bacterium]
MTIGKRLEGKVALVTGGASGIGAESAKVFAEHGAAVAVSDVNDTLGRGVVDEIESKGGSGIYLHLDTTDEEQWEKAVRKTLDRFSTLNVLVNAAGISGRLPDGSPTPKVGQTTLDSWNAVMSVNATGIFLGTKHVIEPMRTAGGGSIINISSIYGIVGSAHSAAYHASKGAVRTFSKSAAIQYAGDRIRVNSVHPGFVDTAMTQAVHSDPERAAPRLASTPLGRFGQPQDIAMGCLYLASDESQWVTGSELIIDGGMTAQ